MPSQYSYSFFEKRYLALGKVGTPAAVLQPRIPADMVAVQMRAHDDVDIVDRDTGGLQRLHPVAVALAMPGRAMRKSLVIADAGIHQIVWCGVLTT